MLPDGDEPIVAVHLTDGRVLTNRVLIARSDHRNPLTEQELRAKFRTTAGQALNQAQVTTLKQAIAPVADTADVRELAELLVP